MTTKLPDLCDQVKFSVVILGPGGLAAWRLALRRYGRF